MAGIARRVLLDLPVHALKDRVFGARRLSIRLRNLGLRAAHNFFAIHEVVKLLFAI